MLHVRLSQEQLNSLGSEVMSRMETTTVYRDNGMVGQVGRWGTESVALFWDVVNGTDVLYRVMSESHNFTS